MTRSSLVTLYHLKGMEYTEQDCTESIVKYADERG